MSYLREFVISTFPILPNEEFSFSYNEKRGVELEFGLKRTGARINQDNNSLHYMSFFLRMSFREM
jgi:hypothetical protein